MVGLLALTANHYIRMDPRVLQKLLSRPQAAQPAVEENVKENTSKLKISETLLQRFWEPLRRSHASQPRSPQQVRQETLDRMKLVETHLLQSSEKQKAVGERLPAAELATLVQVLDQLHARLMADGDAPEEQRKEARLSRLYGLYLAAEMDRTAYSAAFMKVADEGIQSADEIGVSHAAALKLLHQLDFRATSGNDLVRQLGDFTQQFPASEVGVYLYSIVARELWQQERGELADQVLQQGTKVYAGQRGVSRLLNQRLDQKRLP